MNIEDRSVVLDTNILISASINENGAPAQLIRLVAAGKIINYTTYDIIEEVRGVFEKNHIKKAVTEKDKDFLIKGFIEKSIIIIPKFDEKVIIEDPEDNKFINCALTVNANIVSGDSHLLKLRKYKGIEILSPKEFL
ncbi:MAG: putative toxin-antitoxin system toxin component, PIN family [Nanoarchaeota archaeon]|nr:putative toxin-antitoxin system toxin component, PIN family [Nanoarchaeota archaeon]